MKILTPTTHRARKEHVCHWCGTYIFRGRNYIRWTCVDSDESMYRIKVHTECRRAWDEGILDGDPITYDIEVGLGEHAKGCLCQKGCSACQE